MHDVAVGAEEHGQLGAAEAEGQVGDMESVGEAGSVRAAMAAPGGGLDGPACSCPWSGAPGRSPVWPVESN